MSPKKSPGPLATTLHDLRNEAGLSMYELARRSGVNRAQLHRIEQGTNRYPKVESLHKIAAGLGIDPTPLCDAAWAEHTGPVPSVGTYLRTRFDISDQQVEKVKQLLSGIGERDHHDVEAA